VTTVSTAAESDNDIIVSVTQTNTHTDTPTDRQTCRHTHTHTLLENHTTDVHDYTGDTTNERLQC